MCIHQTNHKFMNTSTHKGLKSILDFYHGDVKKIHLEDLSCDQATHKLRKTV